MLLWMASAATVVWNAGKRLDPNILYQHLLAKKAFNLTGESQ